MCGISPDSLHWLGCENDKLVSMANAEFIVNNVPNVEFYKYATGGHVPMIGQQSEEVYAKMLDFIKKHSSN